jgi:hypothetical protein
MFLSIQDLQDIIKKELPLPGSINFDNCSEFVEIPLFRRIGIVCYGVEGDKSGFASGGSEFVRDLSEVLRFRKNKTDCCWDIEFISLEQKNEIEKFKHLLIQLQPYFKTMDDKKLWKVFSIFIRLRDSNADGYGSCFTCGKPLFWKDGDCGHGLGRQHLSTKYDEKNNHLQCKPCNGFEGGRREIYKKKMNERYGQQTWDLLEIKSKSICKWSRFEVEALTNHYRKEIKRLLLNKNFKFTIP